MSVRSSRARFSGKNWAQIDPRRRQFLVRIVDKLIAIRESFKTRFVAGFVIMKFIIEPVADRNRILLVQFIGRQRMIDQRANFVLSA